MTTTRDHFIAALDADPANQTIRLVFADWLEEHSEDESDRRLCAGLRWMAANGKWPDRFRHRRAFVNSNPEEECYQWWLTGLAPSYAVIPDDVSIILNNKTGHSYSTRHAAEVALADALWDTGITASNI